MASTIPSNEATVPNSGIHTSPSATAVAESESKPEALETEADAASHVTETTTADGTDKKWPGWPGDCVFRLVVPVLKVGGIIGRKGDIIRKMCEDTKARIRVLDAPVGTPDRIVLIHGKEETGLALSPAMDAVIRVFKRINEFPENESESISSVPFCSIRMLVTSIQATSLIGKQGSTIKSIQESTGCSVRVFSSVSGNSEERVVDMQGEAIKVLKALEAVLGHLRKFLVDRSVIPLFEKTNIVAAVTQENHASGGSQLQREFVGGGDYSLPFRRETSYVDREPIQRESHVTSYELSLYGRDPALARTGGPIVTQIVQTMQIPLVCAEEIIGVEGTNIAYIRRTSGAVLTVQEIRGLSDEITLEVKGTASQVQIAQQLIQECVYGQKDSIQSRYGNLEPDLRSAYSQLENSSYPSGRAAYGRHETSRLGGYNNSYRF